jgi:hypothetical protein
MLPPCSSRSVSSSVLNVTLLGAPLLAARAPADDGREAVVAGAFHHAAIAPSQKHEEGLGNPRKQEAPSHFADPTLQ